MSKYSVIVSHVVDDYVWGVYEHTTDQVIDTFFFEEDAIEQAQFMENGGAFDGFTPAFMMNMVEIKSDLNEAFEHKFMV